MGNFPFRAHFHISRSRNLPIMKFDENEKVSFLRNTFGQNALNRVLQNWTAEVVCVIYYSLYNEKFSYLEKFS